MSPLHQVAVHRAPDLGITAMELASNHHFPRHSHDEYGIGVVLSGAQRSWSGMGQVESLPGDVITVNPGEVHDGHPIRGATRRWRILYFDPELLAHTLLPDAGAEIEFLSPSLHDVAAGDAVNLLFERLSRGADQLGIEEIIAQIVPRLSGRIPPERCRHSAPVARARARIEDDPSQPVTLAELAALSSVSRYQIVRTFARELGATPYAYLIQCRVRLARRLIAGGAAFAEAAHASGFADQSHMTRAFVRQFGVTPGRYRGAGLAARPSSERGDSGSLNRVKPAMSGKSSAMSDDASVSTAAGTSPDARRSIGRAAPLLT
ncbi:AraC family transcriptional regulator [Bradyrhizobium sp.]|uniref:AraC family transcriptional regulator n=1 Tax=Bradyrhizobium sp. TaxID=376 RepID=UPI0025BED189|nr:AraC family transcriptional regulator [Bradyrhizobium sp.]